MTKLIDAPDRHIESLSYTVEALIATARLALDNETSGAEIRDRAGYAAEETLRVAQDLMGILSEGILISAQNKGSAA